MKLTQEQAQAICDAHEIEQVFGDLEEMELLHSNNPELYHAYEVLVAIAHGG